MATVENQAEEVRVKWDLKNLNDQPAKEDEFGYKGLVNQVVELIPTFEPPKGLAISGPWGVGKTSFLKMVREQLDLKEKQRKKPRGKKVQGENRTITVWFDAWKYQDEPEPIVALLQTIRSELDWIAKFNEFKPEKLLASLALDAISKAIPTKQTFKEHREKEFLEKLPTDKLNSVLEQAISFMTERGQKLVIFIDDLDRCHSDGMSKLLDGIMHYLSLANCIVVFGINLEMLSHAMKRKTGEDAYLAKEYFEKICREIIQLPIPNHEVRAKYFSKLGQAINLDVTIGDENFKNLVGTLKDTWILPPNPRKIKAYANATTFFAKHHKNMIDEKNLTDEDLKTLVLVSGLYHFYPELYKALTSQTEDYYVNRILKFANGEDMSEYTDFQHFTLPIGFRTVSEISPTPREDQEEFFTYADAHDVKVFRLQKLILELKAVEYNKLSQWFIKAKL